MASRQISALALAASLFVTSGCEQGFGLEPEPIDLSSESEFFNLIVEPQGSAREAFLISKREYAQITLVVSATDQPREPLQVPVHLRLGRLVGSDCTEIVGGRHTPALTSQIEAVLEAGAYCVEVIDVGTLPETIGALIRVVHPAPLTRPQPQTLTSRSNITVGGSFTRTFEATAQGTLAVTLTELAADVEVGVGVGIEYDSLLGCRLSRIVNARPRANPHISLEVDHGTYCVQVFDLGQFTETTAFGLRIEHP